MGNSDQQNTNLYDPLFNEAWEKAILYDLADWVNGIAFRDVNFTIAGKPVIKIAEVKNGISSQTKYTDTLFDSTVHITSGDMLFCWSGQPETSIDIFYWRGIDGWLNQHIFKVNVLSDVNHRYFYYIMKYIKPNLIEIAKNKQTTGLGHVTKKDLQNISVRYPSTQKQQAIAHILGTLDDKIELLRSMNETLEAMARALFKSWFIDFDPVRKKAEGQPTGLPPEIDALFPDSFEDSELGEIPKGWNLEKLGQVLSIYDSKRIPLSSRERSNRQGKYPYYGATSIMDYIDDFIFDGVYILLGEDGSVVRTDGTPFVQYVWGRFWANNHAHVLQGNGISNEHLYLFLNQCNVSAFSTGAVQAKLNQDNMKKLPFLLADQKINDAFASMLNPFFSSYRSTAQELSTLMAIRDSLLPRLISGEIELSDKDITKIMEPVK